MKYLDVLRALPPLDVNPDESTAENDRIPFL